METGQTTKLKTLRYYFQRFMLGITSTSIPRDAGRQGTPVLCSPAKLLRHGIEALRGIYGTLLMASRNHPETCPVSAHTAGLISCLPEQRCFAAGNARRVQGITPELTMNREYAPFVDQRFRSIAIWKQGIAAVCVPQELRVTSVRPAGKADVYCLHVPVHGCFALANGTIVSNSDALGYRVEHDFPIVKQLSRMQISGT
jgi:hypothetical protein